MSVTKSPHKSHDFALYGPNPDLEKEFAGPLDPTTRDTAHADWVGSAVQALALELGEDHLSALELGHAAQTHDLGKLYLPRTLLEHDRILIPLERLIMETHTTLGARRLHQGGAGQAAVLAALSHHERWDGSGYPHGLAGEHIAFSARLTSVVDVYEALTTSRSYKPAWSTPQAMSYLRDQAGVSFDARITTAFIALAQSPKLPPRH